MGVGLILPARARVAAFGVGGNASTNDDYDAVLVIYSAADFLELVAMLKDMLPTLAMLTWRPYM